MQKWELVVMHKMEMVLSLGQCKKRLMFTALHFTEVGKVMWGKNLIFFGTVSCFHYHSRKPCLRKAAE